MTPFYRNLSHSWIKNRLQVSAWYYRNRFPILGNGSASCRAVFALPTDPRRYQLNLAAREDAIQALNIFRDGNAWNTLKLETAPAIILDLGANRGFSSLFWKCRYPGAALHGIEMNADNAERCRRLFADNQMAATFHQMAVGDRDGTLPFRPHASHTRHRLANLIDETEKNYTYEQTTVEVPCLKLASFLSEQKIQQVDLLKVDIEGAEQFLLETIHEWAPAIRVMLLEIHHNIDVAWARQQVLAAGFEVDLGDSSNRTEWWCRRSK